MNETKMLWMNRETGHLLTYNEMVEEGREWYDLDDDTNSLAYNEYYECTGEFVPEGWGNDNESYYHEDDNIEMGFDPYEGCYTWDC